MERAEPAPEPARRADAAHARTANSLRIEVVHCAARGLLDHCALDLPVGATLAHALQASGILQRHPALAEAGAGYGVWGRVCSLQHTLEDGDRVEVYRPLLVEPQQARRERQRAQRRLQAKTPAR